MVCKVIKLFVISGLCFGIISAALAKKSSFPHFILGSAYMVMKEGDVKKVLVVNDGTRRGTCGLSFEECDPYYAVDDIVKATEGKKYNSYLRVNPRLLKVRARDAALFKVSYRKPLENEQCVRFVAETKGLRFRGPKMKQNSAMMSGRMVSSTIAFLAPEAIKPAVEISHTKDKITFKVAPNSGIKIGLANREEIDFCGKSKRDKIPFCIQSPKFYLHSIIGGSEESLSYHGSYQEVMDNIEIYSVYGRDYKVDITEV